MAEADSNKLAILFADMVGSTHLFDKFGNERGHAAVNECIAALKQVTQNFRGRTVKTRVLANGDGISRTSDDVVAQGAVMPDVPIAYCT